jgi:histidinol phosphatase-like enzyme (inositol monophosphatase family)
MSNPPGHAFEPSLQALSDFAETLADEVRPLSLGWFRKRLEVDVKADESPVTIADRNVEQALRRRIAERFPAHGILGEEFGVAHGDAEFVWSIDPIDGTRSFITGYPLWGTLLAVLHRGKPLVGVIDMPMLAERWVGRLGQGAWLNGAACATSGVSRLADATVYATTPDIFQGAEADAFERLSRAARNRRFGGDCYCYALLASGHVDLVMEAGLQPYDYLALAPVIEAAGGVITDWDGQPLTLASRGRVIAAANARLHREALAVIGHVPS